MAEKTTGATKKSDDEGEVDPSYVEDRSKPGWPQLQRGPFVDPRYYERAGFPKEIHPVIELGGSSGASLTVDQAEKISKRWAEPFSIVTVVNMCESTWSTHLLGPDPDTIIAATVPPFGVLRGVLAEELKAGIHGSRFPLRYLLAAHADAPKRDAQGRALERDVVGNCNVDKDVTEPMANGERLPSCNVYGCKRPGHHCDKWAHTIKQAQLFVASCGEALPDPNDPKHSANYVPFLKEAEEKIHRFKKLDPRQAVHLFLTDRVEYIRDREARFTVDANRGRGVPGR